MDQVIDNRGTLKESLFMITINTNRVPQDNNQRCIFENIMLNAVMKLKDRNYRRHVINFLNNDTIENAIIHKEEIKVGFEDGKKKKRFHAHIVWDFVHETKLQLDLFHLKQLFLAGYRDEFGWANLHMDVKAVSNVKRNLEEYAKKQDSDGHWKVYNVQ
jgi:hypothetical protein